MCSSQRSKAFRVGCYHRTIVSGWRLYRTDPVHASSERNKTLVDSLRTRHWSIHFQIDIITAADKLKCLITDIQTYSGAVSLDITSGSMASRTEEGFYVTLVNGVFQVSSTLERRIF